MTIKFFCSCGKHLRAREAMAGRRSMCPACGQPVGVPTLQPTHRGTEPAPLTPTERARRGHYEASDDRAAAGERAEGDSKRPRRLPRRALALEKHWFQCLLYPFHVLPLVAGFAVILTLISLGIAAWPELRTQAHWGAWLAVLGALAGVLGLVAAFLNGVLASAALGEVGIVSLPGFDVRGIGWALLAWTASFLAGPILFAAAAFAFWFYAGDPKPIDWLIVTELAVVGAGHWLLALVAVHQGERLLDANPVRVGDVIRRLGYGVVVATLGAVTVSLGFGAVIVYGLAYVFEEPVIAAALLFGGWLGNLGWLTFLFRLLGLWCFKSRVEAWYPATEATAPAPGAA